MEENNTNYDLGKKFEEEYKKIEQSIQKPNILLAGATGVGKSSLINMIFGEDVAQVGTGKPVTQRIDIYESADCDVKIFDSKGYELADSDDDEFYDTVINMAAKTQRPEDAIHMVWYCIASNGARVQDYDLRALDAFTKCNIPIAVILTKADTPSEEEISEMRAQIPARFMDSIFETSTKNEEYNQTKALVDWSIARLPESLRFAFIKSQKIDLKTKQKTARKYIKQQCALAFGVGFAPIPMSDAPLLVANEMSLIARILYLYDLGSVSDIIKTTGLSSMLGGLLTNLGKSAVANLIKMIPGIGTVVGGAISGSVGSIITAGVGEAASVTAYQISNAKLSGDYAKAEDLIHNFGPTIMSIASEWIKSGKKVEDLPE